jgi:fido (protein-threonine AMPylation protein)
MPGGRLSYDLAVHARLFQDVYSWARKIRTVGILQAVTVIGATRCYHARHGSKHRRFLAHAIAECTRDYADDVLNDLFRAIDDIEQ